MSDNKKILSAIEVPRGREFAESQGLETGPTRSPEEDWAINLNALKQYSRAGDWVETLKVLEYLSTRENHPDVQKAMAQRAWLTLKTDTPLLQTTLALYNLLVYLGDDHPASGAIASLAHMIVQHRGDGQDPDIDLARAQTQQMLKHAADAFGVEEPEEFKYWVSEQKLDQPEHFIPLVMSTLDELVEGDWWFDHIKAQAELEANSQEEKTLN